MVKSTVVKEELWRTALKAFRRNIHQLGPWVLGLTAIMIIADFHSIRDQIQHFTDMLDKVDKMTDPSNVDAFDSSKVDKMGMLNDEMQPNFSPASLISMLVEWFGYYGFTVLYLQREPIAYAPHFGVESFLKWAGRILLGALIVLGVGLGVVVAGSLIVGALYFINHQEQPALVMVVGGVAMLALVFMGVKFTMVGPLVLSRLSRPLKNSWELTRKNWWRILWHYLMIVSVLWFFLFVAYLIPMGLLCYYTDTSAQSVPFVAGVTVMMCLSKAIILAGGSVYFCVVCRKLCEEQGLPAPAESGSISKTA